METALGFGIAYFLADIISDCKNQSLIRPNIEVEGTGFTFQLKSDHLCVYEDWQPVPSDEHGCQIE